MNLGRGNTPVDYSAVDFTSHLALHVHDSYEIPQCRVLILGCRIYWALRTCLEKARPLFRNSPAGHAILGVAGSCKAVRQQEGGSKAH